MDLKGKKVSVLGAGRSGQAAAVLARSEGAQVTLYDENPNASCAEDLTLVSGISLADAEKVLSDLIVLSPGIDTYGPFVGAFCKNGGPLIGELELACNYYSGRIVAITGTNGKTTTTALVSAFLEASGISCPPCGNYGTPLSEILLEGNEPEAIALEVSSFQLETIRDFHPEVAVWMNFAADHMDRYPDLDSYKAAKLRIFENQDASDRALVRAGETLPEIEAELTTFSSLQGADWTLFGPHIMCGDAKVLDFSASRLRGKHNAENVMVAAAVGRHFGLSDSLMQQTLEAFTPPAHRCELVGTLDNVEYVNDSKATNLHALESALTSQQCPIVLIAGGKEKGLDYSALPPLLRKHAIAAVTYGEIGNKLGGLIDGSVPVSVVKTLSEAVLEARSLAIPGSMVLLSPGTSSFDQFSGYEARGEAFREAVAQLAVA